jgi:antirestriction protein ArdC
MSAPRPRRSKEEASDALERAHGRLSAAVEQLVSGADWQAMLTASARFHDYSHGNILLLLAQCHERGISEPTRFASYRAWQALGRQVRRGETGLEVFSPIYRRSRDAAADDDVDRTHLQKETSKRTAVADEPRNVLAGYKIVAGVFELSQTDGDPLPDVVPKLLAGEAPAALYAGLAKEVAASGFRLLREDCSPANGQTDFVARTVTVRPDCSPAQAAKTLAHELGHVRLHDDPRFIGLGGSLCRGLAEVEAESVAFLVCSTAGLSTDGYSFAYVARWANGDVDLVRSAGERSLDAARVIGRSLGLVPPARDRASERVLAASRAARPDGARRSGRPLTPERRALPQPPTVSSTVASRPGPSRGLVR